MPSLKITSGRLSSVFAYRAHVDKIFFVVVTVVVHVRYFAIRVIELHRLLIFLLLFSFSFLCLFLFFFPFLFSYLRFCIAFASPTLRCSRSVSILNASSPLNSLGKIGHNFLLGFDIGERYRYVAWR